MIIATDDMRLTQHQPSTSLRYQRVTWHGARTSIVSCIRESYHELARCGSSWTELLFGLISISSGLWVGWPVYRPYVSNSAIYSALTRDLWADIFVIAGLIQLLCFVLRKRKLRINAAVVSAGLWWCVTVILWQDKAPGWMTPTSTLIAIFQVAVWYVLCRRKPREAWTSEGEIGTGKPALVGSDGIVTSEG